MMIDKRYYRLAEVADEWECEVLDLFYFAREKGLKLSFIVRNVTAEVIMAHELYGKQNGKSHGRETMANRIFDLPGRAAIDIEEKGWSQGSHLPVPAATITCITPNGEFEASRIRNEHYRLGDHKVRLKDVVITKENLTQFPRPTPLFHGEYPPEMAVAFECYQSLYGKGVPDGLNSKNETSAINKWLNKHYSFSSEKQKIRIATIVNPVITKRPRPPARKKK